MNWWLTAALATIALLFSGLGAWALVTVGRVAPAIAVVTGLGFACALVGGGAGLGALGVAYAE